MSQAIPSVDGPDTAADQRAVRRTKVFVLGQASADTDSTSRVHVLDFSSEGARINSVDIYPVGQILELSYLDERHIAQVVWVDGQRHGLAYCD